MSAEIRINRMYNAWKEVREAREKVDDSKKKWQYHKKMARSLSQKMGQLQREEKKLLDEYDKMV